MCVTPGNVSFVNCGKSSIVISPYFCFISSRETPPFTGERAGFGGAAAPRPPLERVLKIHRIG